MGDLTRILLGRDPLLNAYLSFTPRACGNAGCKRRRGQKHPARIVRLQEGRQARMRSVSREVYERLKPLADSYREFREATRRWRRLAREAETIFKDIERLREVDPDQTLELERELAHGNEEPEDGWTGGPDGDSPYGERRRWPALDYLIRFDDPAQPGPAPLPGLRSRAARPRGLRGVPPGAPRPRGAA